MLSIVDETKIIKYLNSHSMNDIYYYDFKEIINNKKYKDSDLFEYFFIKVKESFQKEKTKEKLVAKFLFLLALFLDIFHENDIVIDEEMCKELLNLKEMYENYKNKTGKEENEDIRSMLEQIEEYLNKYHLIEKSENFLESKKLEELSTKISKLEQKIASQRIDIEKLTKKNVTSSEQLKLSDKKIRELRGIKISQYEEIKQLRKELEKLSRNYENSETENKKNNENVRFLEKENAKYLNIIKEQDKKLSLLQEENKKLIKKLEELEEQQKQMESQAKLKNELEEALAELTALKMIIQEKEKKEQQKQEEKSQEENRIKEIILKELFEKSKTITELQKILESNNYNLTKEEIYCIISNLRKERYPISSFYLSNGEPKYTLSEQKSFINKKRTIDLEKGKNYIDIIFVSDFHVDFTQKNFYENYDKLLNYCTEHNIHYIVNLGDFFDFTNHGEPMDYNRFIEVKRNVEKFIHTLPYAPGIYQFVLGGNHDERHLKLKKDFLLDFINAREDFITLGYQNAQLCLQAKKMEKPVNLLLSHPSNQLEKRFLRGRINNLSQKFNAIFDFSFFGHSHISYIDIQNRVCIIPSFSMDHVYNGATHIQFYINENLDYMRIKPLILERTLVPTSQIIYKNSFDK